ncbi:MAG: glycosyltransferase family 2 protein [Thermoanaerobaculaceae bacterium]|nr:glycosyltransferase family 2 protein [Thermoanaerobaculaceae bacterium]MDI9622444.1 glycosyltransferase family 2 protein [Acidobacteriota bacterium]NLH11199.1 glycosyltransferase family 2 protein [Holophagae bacterium]HPW54345.1 glycosyltransferase family 2 protein [Thermoanaerobaculaceae bacterium]
MSSLLGVLVTARDEASMLPGALASVAAWAEEVVVVVDPRSADRTPEIARAAGARVLEHRFESSAAQCNWGLAQCTSSWVLVLDADERVTPSLRAEISTCLPTATEDAFSVARHNFAFGRRLCWGDWAGDRIVRLLRRGRASFTLRAVHGAVEAASIGRLHGALEHHTLRSLAQYLPKLEDYARRGAADLAAAGCMATPGRAFAHAGWRLLRGIVLRLGCLDGWPGMAVAALAAWGAWLKWMLAWEAATTGQRRP